MTEQSARSDAAGLTVLQAHLATDCPDRATCWAKDIHDAHDPRHGVYVPPPAWQWDAWTEQERRDFMDQLDAADITPNRCTCSTWCGESSEAGCPSCVWSDSYAPCPAVGSGCGMTSATPKTCEDEECCTPEQYARAQLGGVVDKFVRDVRALGLPDIADRLARDCAQAATVKETDA